MRLHSAMFCKCWPIGFAFGRSKAELESVSTRLLLLFTSHHRAYSDIVDRVLTYLYEDLKTSRAGKLIVYLNESFSTQGIARSRLEVSTYDFQSDLVVSAQTKTSSRSLVYG